MIQNQLGLVSIVKGQKMSELVDEAVDAPRVTYAVGYTRNMGNFESLRVDIGLTDSARAGETFVTAFDRVAEQVDELLIAKIQELQAEVEATK